MYMHLNVICYFIELCSLMSFHIFMCFHRKVYWHRIIPLNLIWHNSTQEQDVSNSTHDRSMHQSKAFWNILNQGDTSKSLLIPWGIQGHCHGRKHLSGWGMMARCRPSSEQRAATPSREPLGLKG